MKTEEAMKKDYENKIIPIFGQPIEYNTRNRNIKMNQSVSAATSKVQKYFPFHVNNHTSAVRTSWAYVGDTVVTMLENTTAP